VPDFPSGLVDRGIGFQAAGFTLVLSITVAILELLEGSNLWLYQWFERASTEIYWSSLVPLAALFDWTRKMFERGKAIREAKKAEIREKGRKEGREEGRREAERIKALLESPGVTLPPEVASAIFGDKAKSGC
jgi:hypothetical protein